MKPMHKPRYNSDYTILVYSTCNVMTKEPIRYYTTAHFLRAVRMYFKFSREYKTATIIFKHNKYW